MNKLPELKQIIADAPDGATEVCQIERILYYVNNRDNGHEPKIRLNGEWVFSELICDFNYRRNVRLLADIRTIIEKEERISKLEKYNLDLANESHAKSERIAELENHKNYYQDFLEVNTDCKSITELVGKYKRQSQCIVELEQKLKPSLCWDASNTEISHDSIEELMHCKFEDGAEVGDEVEIQRAALLPNETYVFTKIDDEDYSCEYELKEQK